MEQNFSHLYPEGITPYSHQLEAVKWLSQKFKQREALILGSVMGTGKSGVYVMLSTLENVKRVLVIAPAGAVGVVESEFEMWSPKPLTIQVILSGKDIVSPLPTVIICSYDLCYRTPILRQLLNLDYDIIIFEEAHNLGSKKSQRTRACLGNLWPKTRKKLFVTGSVTRDKVTNLYPILRRCIPEKVKNETQFQVQNCNAIPGEWGTKYVGLRKDAPIVTERWLSEIMIRHGKEVLKDLPPKTERKIKLRSKELEDIMNAEAEAAFSANPPENDRDVPSEYAEMRHELGLIKIRPVMEFIDYWLEENTSSLVLGCYHRDICLMYRREFAERHIPVVGIMGGDSSNRRNEAVRAFQAGEARIFVATFAAAEAITLTRSSNLMFAELSFSLSANEQFMDRVHRIGQRELSTIYFLQTEHFIDKALWSAYKSKSRIKAKILGS